jgi:23S rRNA (guanine2445-N2)-methyltransferase / 23S rRNA (guanine2069-N7)-methyltransferase
MLESYATLADPCCGSGTIAIEAALIALDRAPGALRDYWGFTGWLQHDEALWSGLLDEADTRAEDALERYEALRALQMAPLVSASDIDPAAVEIARQSARKAGVEQYISFAVSDVAEFVRAKAAAAAAAVANVGSADTDTAEALCVSPQSFIVTNPPYGHRMGATSQLPALYAALRACIDPALSGHVSTLCVISSDADMQAYLGLAPQRRIATFNGAIEAEILCFAPAEPVSATPAPELEAESSQDRPTRSVVSSMSQAHAEPAAADLAAIDARDIEQFENRLTKMASHRAKWARRSGISCYRIYDADLPSFAVAIDLYEGAGPDEGVRWLHIAEYAPPAHIDAARAMQRLAVVLDRAPRILGVPLSQVYLKTRRKAKGGGQYPSQKSGETQEQRAQMRIIAEDGLLFQIDLSSHLDTGIFLDHRMVRALLKTQAASKDCLNLFAYTGTASVYMAAGGAQSVTTVDLSRSYLEVAQRNMERNKFHVPPELFIRADVLAWVRDNRHAPQKYGLIFCDVPTFSNSSLMGTRTWDVQRDHAELLIALSRMLTPEGLIVFSTNLRSFTPELEPLQKAGVDLEDISAASIPADFERTPKIHRCYLVRRKKLNA